MSSLQSNRPLSQHHQTPIVPVKRMVTVEKVPSRQMIQPSSATVTSLKAPTAQVFQLSLDDSDEGSDTEDSVTNMPPPSSSRALPPTPYFPHGALEPIAEQSDILPSPHPEDDDEDNSSQPSTPTTLNQQQDRFQDIIARILDDQFGPTPDSQKSATSTKEETKTNTLATSPDDNLNLNINETLSKPATSSTLSSVEIITPNSSTVEGSPNFSSLSSGPTKESIQQSKEWRLSKSNEISTTNTTLRDAPTDKQATLAAALNIKPHSQHQLKVETAKFTNRLPSPAASIATQSSLSPPPSQQHYTSSIGNGGSYTSMQQNSPISFESGSVRSTSSFNSPIPINNKHHSWSSQHRPIQSFQSIRRRSSKEEMSVSDTLSDVDSSIGTSSVSGGHGLPPHLQRLGSRTRNGPTFTSYKSCNDLFVVRHALESNNSNNNNSPLNITPPPLPAPEQNHLRSSASYATLASNSIHSSMFQEPYQAQQPRRYSDQLATRRDLLEPPNHNRLPPTLDHRLSTLSLNPNNNCTSNISLVSGRGSTSSIYDASLCLQPPVAMHLPHHNNPSMISLQHHHHLPPPPAQDDTTTLPGFMPNNSTSTSRLSIASFSLTHDKDAIKTYRRMANKTNNKDVQMTYCKYLLQVAELYEMKDRRSTAADRTKLGTTHSATTTDKTRRRLLEEAEYWIEKLAAGGYPEALYIKGMWHATNDHDCVGVIYQGINHEKAFKCLRVAAKHGWVEASYQVARYWKDRGDYKKTLASYKLAAHQGHVLANYKMAKILLRGQLGQKVNIKQGLEYLKSAADATTDDSAQAAFDLSCVYSDDIEMLGMERDCLASRKNVTMAMHYLLKAHHSGLVSAYHQLGKVYELGLLDQPRDRAVAFENYSKAAEQGHVLAMLDVSRFYLQGVPELSMPSHHELAFKWCQRSASHGLAQAEFALGTHYESGIGVAVDYPRALEWFGKSASKGYPPAAERLNLPEKTKIKTSKPTTSSSTDCTIM